MTEITIIIEKGNEKNKYKFYAFCLEIDLICGFGNTIDECKKRLLENIETLRQRIDPSVKKLEDGYKIRYFIEE